jgi:hypothetical protein
MDYSKLILVFFITLILVVGVNAIIYVMLRRINAVGEIDMFRRAANRVRRPWGQEDDDLEELSRRVRAFSNPDEGNGAK